MNGIMYKEIIRNFLILVNWFSSALQVQNTVFIRLLLQVAPVKAIVPIFHMISHMWQQISATCKIEDNEV